MKKILTVISIAVMTFGGNVSAFELEDTPIRTALKNNILLAEEWNVDSEEGDKNDDPSELSTSPKKKYSTAKAAIYSILLPGLGEHYVGSKTKAKYFFAAEAMTWLGYLSFHMYGNWKQDDYIQYASDYAGAQLEGKDEEFIEFVGFYDSREDFNSLGRVTDPERAYLYNTPEYDWQWTSEDDRLRFKDIKNSSKEAFRKRDFMIVAAIANRLVSMIDVIRDVKKKNRNIVTDISQNDRPVFKLSFQPMSYNRQVSLTFYPSF